MQPLRGLRQNGHPTAMYLLECLVASLPSYSQRLHGSPTSAPSATSSARSTWVSAPPFKIRSSSYSCVTLVNGFPQPALSRVFTTSDIVTHTVFVLRIYSLTLVVVRRDVFRFLNPDLETLDQLPRIKQLRVNFDFSKLSLSLVQRTQR